MPAAKRVVGDALELGELRPGTANRTCGVRAVAAILHAGPPPNKRTPADVPHFQVGSRSVTWLHDRVDLGE